MNKDLLEAARKHYADFYRAKYRIPPETDVHEFAVDYPFATDFAAKYAAEQVKAERKATYAVIVEVSELNPFPEQFGDGAVLTGMTPNDIYQMGYANCLMAIKKRLSTEASDGKNIS